MFEMSNLLVPPQERWNERKGEQGTSGALSCLRIFALLGELLFGDFRYVLPLETSNC